VQSRYTSVTMVRPSGIEPLSPGYRPGALPLSDGRICTSHSVLRRGMNRVRVVPRRGWPGASAVNGQRGRDRTDDLLFPKQARFHFATRWRPVRESNPRCLIENQRALPLAERDSDAESAVEVRRGIDATTSRRTPWESNPAFCPLNRRMPTPVRRGVRIGSGGRNRTTRCRRQESNLHPTG
jgi:hypothetical protein